eukprot:1658096-Pleurochrysis_carterae.AAC.1
MVCASGVRKGAREGIPAWVPARGHGYRLARVRVRAVAYDHARGSTRDRAREHGLCECTRERVRERARAR